MGTMIVDAERIAKLEVEVGYTKEDVSEIKVEVKAQREDSKSIAKSMTKLTTMFEQVMADIKPQQEKTANRLDKLERLVWKAVGGLAVLLTISTIASPYIIALINHQ